MKRNLLKQMSKEWLDNVWLIIELTIVCLAIWVIISLLYTYTQGLFKPRGYNADNVYCLDIGTVPPESEEYIPIDEDYHEANYADIKTLISRIRDNKNVETVTQHYNGVPYNYDFTGGMLFLAHEVDTVGYYGNVRTVNPDYIRVMGITSKTGASEDQLIAMLNNGELLISDDNEHYAANGLNPYDLKGKMMIMGNDSSHFYRVGDIIQKVRRNDYEMSWGGTIIFPMNEASYASLAIRVKPGKGNAFEEDFRNDPGLRKQRNIYLDGLKSVDNIKEGNQRSIEAEIRLYEIMVAFLLMTIFLGLLGTFWFRMQQRVSEIAIRKVAGAKRSQIFRRILSEGMILLGCAVIIISAIIWPMIFCDAEIINIGIEKTTILLIEAATIVLVAIGIIISLWWPARKAMSIEPAIAIKDE